MKSLGQARKDIRREKSGGCQRHPPEHILLSDRASRARVKTRLAISAVCSDFILVACRNDRPYRAGVDTGPATNAIGRNDFHSLFLLVGLKIRWRSLNLHHLFLLVGNDIIRFLDISISQFLNFFFPAFEIIFGDFLAFFKSF